MLSISIYQKADTRISLLISILFFTAILITLPTSTASAAAPFLKLPLKKYTHATAPISSFFDHTSGGDHEGDNYTEEDGYVRIFNGAIGHNPNYKNVDDGCYDLTSSSISVPSSLNYDGLGEKYGDLCYDGHSGIDYAVEIGTSVAAAASGKVVFAGWIAGAGNMVAIDHLNGFGSRYLHLNSISVGLGKINQGDVIGTSGNTGGVGAHLHFDVNTCNKGCASRDSMKVDPFGDPAYGELWLDWSLDQTKVNISPIISFLLSEPHEPEPPVDFKLPDTGQTKCYDSSTEIPCPLPGQDYYGQDANYEGTQPMYHDNGNGTITDINTGLIWTQATADTNNDNTIDSNDPLTWQAAIDHCTNLNFAGYSDWRLPELLELESIVDYGQFDPSINTVFSAQLGYYWSATENAKYASMAWQIHFSSSGNIWNSKTTSIFIAYVRCVRGKSLPTGSYTDNNNGTVSDQSTGLMWMKNSVDTDNDGSANTLSWKNALSYCENLNFAGHDDWRLPNIRELKRLVDQGRYDPAIDPLFTAHSSEYWSANTYPVDTDPDDAYKGRCIEFFHGDSRWALKTTAYHYTRCVRSGKSDNELLTPTISSVNAYDTHVGIRLDIHGSNFSDNPTVIVTDLTTGQVLENAGYTNHIFTDTYIKIMPIRLFQIRRV